SWSLRRPCRICYSAPNICSALPELSAMGCSVTLGASFHRYTRRWRFRCLVAWPPHRDLLLCAKHLFIAATCQLVAPYLRERHHTLPRLKDLDGLDIRFLAPAPGIAFGQRTASRPFGAAVGRDALGPELARRVRGEMDHDAVRVDAAPAAALVHLAGGIGGLK